MTDRYARWLAMLAQRDAGLLSMMMLGALFAVAVVFVCDWQALAIVPWRWRKVFLALYLMIGAIVFNALLVIILFAGGNS